MTERKDVSVDWPKLDVNKLPVGRYVVTNNGLSTKYGSDRYRCGYALAISSDNAQPFGRITIPYFAVRRSTQEKPHNPILTKDEDGQITLILHQGKVRCDGLIYQMDSLETQDVGVTWGNGIYLSEKGWKQIR